MLIRIRFFRSLCGLAPGRRRNIPGILYSSGIKVTKPFIQVEKTIDWDIAREWEENEAVFNKYLKLLKMKASNNFL